jgi:hypothetical protein
MANYKNIYSIAHHSGRAVEGMKWLFQLKPLDHEFKSPLGMDVCLRLICSYTPGEGSDLAIVLELAKKSWHLYDQVINEKRNFTGMLCFRVLSRS